ncbi:MAG: adenosylcobinamide-GDP ribazoletransferase [Nitrospira sp.]|nr:adenosylcobinamide-GDP ribazoletransferase [Nitrospira sp.]MDE0403777.1 adenosylcobinamide-GDP ribazoletransferase [Nitrospira sp.]MDE0486457.1 adenosylcobinamide-GDP ribazoletransferase [Nitrospira sp.]
MIRFFLLAWHFLTIIPLYRSQHVQPAPRELASSMQWYPAVGLAIGGILVAADTVFGMLLTPDVTALFILCLLVVLTGGLHQDGLADTIDGLAKRGSVVERLAVMKDGRIGALGATGLTLALGLRFAGILHLPSPDRMGLLLCMPVIGKWAMVVSTFGSSHARAEGGLASGFLNEIWLKDMIWPTVWAGIFVCAILGWQVGGLLLGLSGVAARVMVFLCSRVFGGITGDVLGAINEGTEILFLFAAPLILTLVVL